MAVNEESGNRYRPSRLITRTVVKVRGGPFPILGTHPMRLWFSSV